MQIKKIVTYLPSSSCKSYSSVNRVDAATEFNVGELFTMIAMLILSVTVTDRSLCC